MDPPLPSEPPFAWILPGIDSTRCWKNSSEMLVHIDIIASRSCWKFVGCTSMMWISRSTTSQRCSIGLRSGDCGGHLSKVNSLSCSRNQSEMIWALWTWCIILLKVAMRIKGIKVIKAWHGRQQYSGRLWRLNNAQLVLRGPKCAKKISPTPLHHHHQPEPLRQGRMDPCFHVLYAKFWPYHLNVAAEIETLQTRQRFYKPLLSNFGEPVRIVDSVSCS